MARRRLSERRTLQEQSDGRQQIQSILSSAAADTRKYADQVMKASKDPEQTLEDMRDLNARSFVTSRDLALKNLNRVTLDSIDIRQARVIMTAVMDMFSFAESQRELEDNEVMFVPD